MNPAADEAKNLVDGVILCTRILGYVNAPGLMQRVICSLQGVSVDVEIYRRKRDLFCAALAEMGYQFAVPEGAFYIFPKAPGGDDLAVVRASRKSLSWSSPVGASACPGISASPTASTLR